MYLGERAVFKFLPGIGLIGPTLHTFSHQSQVDSGLLLAGRHLVDDGLQLR